MTMIDTVVFYYKRFSYRELELAFVVVLPSSLFWQPLRG